MAKPSIVSREAWVDARKALLAKEKAFTRARDALTAERQQLPWVRVAEEYEFTAIDGPRTLSQLFGTSSQLIVQHFMLGDGWPAGCPSCSFWADNYDGIARHLAARDTAFVTISNAPIGQIEAYRRRMGWTFLWVSAHGTSFNADYHVSFSEEEQKNAYYNYKNAAVPVSEAPGVSVFSKDGEGTIFHSYSCYARGLDMLNGAYHYIDLTPKGRDEAELPFTMAWVKRHDEYEN